MGVVVERWASVGDQVDDPAWQDPALPDPGAATSSAGSPASPVAGGARTPGASALPAPQPSAHDDIADTTLVTLGAAAVVAYRAGDRGPLAELVARATPLLWHVVRSQGVDRDRAEDVVQAVWLSLLRSMGQIRDPQSCLQWLLTTARRAAWRAARQDSAAIASESLDDLHGAGVQLASTAPAPDATVLRSERDRALWAHVDALPDRCKQLLALVALVDRPDYGAVSAALGMPVGSIGPTRGRCLAKLRASLAADPTWED